DIFAQGPKNEEWEALPDDVLLDFDFVVGDKTSLHQKVAQMRRHEFRRTEERRSDFIHKAPVHIHVRALGIDQDPARTVFEEKGNIEALLENRLPCVLVPRLCPLPSLNPVVEARIARHRGSENGWTCRSPVDFNKADGRAADAGKRRVQNHALETKLAKSAPEQVDPQNGAGSSDDNEPEAT